MLTLRHGGRAGWTVWISEEHGPPRTVWHAWRRHVDYCRTSTAICSA